MNRCNIRVLQTEDGGYTENGIKVLRTVRKRTRKMYGLRSTGREWFCTNWATTDSGKCEHHKEFATIN